MSNYDNTNRGAVWRNDDKKSDKHPDLKGNINIEGKEYWLSAWKSDGSNPKAPLLSISVQPKEAAQPKAAPAAVDFDDDLPF